jgi:sulfatase modifying factor 1
MAAFCAGWEMERPLQNANTGVQALSCCPPQTERGENAVLGRLDVMRRENQSAAHQDAVVIQGGKFLMGTNESILPADGEKPARSVRVQPFMIDACAVTNARFSEFVADTSYQTEAEFFGWSYVFFGLLHDPDVHRVLPGLGWWRGVDGATWCTPEGLGSNLDGRQDHPVVHLSWNDAKVFAKWAGGRLPTESEWEFAARGGLQQKRFPWGDREPDDTTYTPCNIWQGAFPHMNTAIDGFIGTAPAKSYEPNGFGLYNMVGNTWEWTNDPFRIRSIRKSARVRQNAIGTNSHFVTKGGSYLCHKSYCFRYRVAARTMNTPDSTTGHTGFRLAYDHR